MSRHQFLWSTTRQSFCRLLQLRYRIGLDPRSDPEPDPPYIAVSNHGNFFDPWIVGRFQRHATRIMMNDDGFRTNGPTRWYLRNIGAFPKKKGASDLGAMKKTLGYLKRGDPVLIFPEGQATWDGETQPIYGGIERMIKRSRCPLVILRVRGNFLTHPWWAESGRRGRIQVSRTAVPTEKLAGMKSDEILKLVLAGIHHNDIADERNAEVPFRGKRLAEGVQRLLWRCMSCGRSDSLTAIGDRITCNQCQASWRLDAHARLHPEADGEAPHGDLHAWFQAHKREARRAVEEAGEETVLARNEAVTLLVEDPDGGFAKRSEGTLELTPRRLSYVPLESGSGARGFPLDRIDSFAIQKKDLFEITVGGEDIRFWLPGRSPMKWLVHLRYLSGFQQAEERGVI
jgi:1-acyl-sn-glycerol-3-phosphate acyltransferase